jgi:predicted Zn-dependent protease
LRQGAARADCPGDARLPVRALSPDQRPQHREGRTLIDIQAIVERVLEVSKADECIVIGRQQTSANIRWASNTVTTNGVIEQVSLSIISIIDRRAASVTRTFFPPDAIEEMVRESEASCAHRPPAPDYMPLIESQGEPRDWDGPAVATDIHALDLFDCHLGGLFDRARRSGIQNFGFAEDEASTVWLATSTGLRRRHSEKVGRVAMTAKTPDFEESAWTGLATHDFNTVDPDQLFDTLEQRLIWSRRRIEIPAGHYEVLLEPSCVADLAIGAYAFMIRREADEGRNPFSHPGGGTRIGERLFGGITMYSDPLEPGISTAPFHVATTTDDAASIFDNGLPVSRTDWVRDGTLQTLVTPRYWAAKDSSKAVPPINNLIVSGDGSEMAAMIASTRRALLVTSLWYIRTVDPHAALLTGLTRDGVFLIENGEVQGAVNNFRWNMSPIAAFDQASEVGRHRTALPREYDEFLRAKAPPMRIERFNMSSVSEAS